MEIYRQTHQYLEIRAVADSKKHTPYLWGIPMFIFGWLIFIFSQSRYGVTRAFEDHAVYSFGLMLILASILLILMAIFLQVIYLSCVFDKERGVLCLTSRKLLYKRVICRSIFDIQQLQVKRDTDVDGYEYYYIKIEMNKGKPIKIMSMNSIPNEQQYYEYLAQEITNFLGCSANTNA
jgi:predicted membrane protein